MNNTLLEKYEILGCSYMANRIERIVHWFQDNPASRCIRRWSSACIYCDEFFDQKSTVTAPSFFSDVLEYAPYVTEQCRVCNSRTKYEQHPRSGYESTNLHLHFQIQTWGESIIIINIKL